METQAFNESPGDVMVDSKVAKVESKLLETRAVEAQASDLNSSYYMMACDQSGDVDRWVRGGVSLETRSVQGSRPTVVQRSILATNQEAALPDTGLWYMMVLTMMPLLNITSSERWRCSHSFVLHVLELGFAHMSTACSRLRCHFRRLARTQMTQEIFATAMDVVLVVYAIGFLTLSVYQAAMFI